MQLGRKIAILTVNHVIVFAAVDNSSHAVALDIDATSGTGADKLASGPEKSEPTRLHSLPIKAAQSTSVDSDAEAVERLLQCPLTKVSAEFERA